MVENRAAVNRPPLSRRPIVRPVSQVSLSLTDKRAFEKAIEETVKWMNGPKRCAGRIPINATGGDPFDLTLDSGMPAAAARLTEGNLSIWAARLDYADADVGQRTWATEISILSRPGTVLFQTRLTNITLGDDRPFTPSVPGIVRQIMSNLSAEADGFPVSEEPFNVDILNMAEFEALLLAPDRRLPILAISYGDSGEPLVPTNLFIRRLAGTVHIVIVPPSISWRLTKLYGRRFSVFNGACRVYFPGFNPEADDPLQHPLQLIGDDFNPNSYANYVARRALSAAVVRPTDSLDNIRFANIRAAALTHSRHKASNSENADTLRETVRELEESLGALERQRKEDAVAAQSLLDEAADDLEEVRREQGELASENDRLRAKLRAVFSSSAARAEGAEDHLDTYDNFEAWADRNLGDAIEILPRAIRATEKSGAVELIRKLEDTLIMIRDDYVPMRRGLDDSARDRFIEKSKLLGVEETACFSQKGQIKAFPEYRVSFGTQKVWLDRHFKYGGGFDPRSMFRIYFYWDDVDQKVIIGHMPTHLDNRST